MKRLYIIGAGFAGRTLATEITLKKVFGQVVAFLDDDPDKIGKKIYGIPILGPIKDVALLLRTNPADEAVIAIPSAGIAYLKEVHAVLKDAGFQKIRILPAVSQIVEGEAHLIQTRTIDLQDLLGRDPVTIKLKQSLSYVRGKRVLVTGAGGSIGSELCRQLLSGGVARLYLLGHGENSIYEIDRELRLLQEEGVGEKANIVPIIGDLKDSGYIDYLLGNLKADTIFHTAAYKHVPMMEENPVAVIENNVFGLENLINAAIKYGVKRFVHISTDKAVNPVSVYGMSKYICEHMVLGKGTINSEQLAVSSEQLEGNREQLGIRREKGKGKREQIINNNEQGTEPCNNRPKSPVPGPQSPVPHFVVVRFGNVLGSRGSIVPLFQKQIEKGGPVTVTHKDARRFFMTIAEACSLVLKAGGVGESGGLYLLDMGEPVRIKDLAEQMIRFNGFEPETDIKIEYTGLRPGERLDEALYSDDEEPVETGHSRILKIERKEPVNIDIDKLLDKLRPVCKFDQSQPELYRNADKLKRILGFRV